MHAAKDLSIGLALSGGGFRATLFGLGSLWRLNEAGLIGRLARVTGVSGGSILAGILAFHWRQLRFVDGRADNFEAVLVPPVRAFCGQSIDIKTAALGHLVDHTRALRKRWLDDDFQSGRRRGAYWGIGTSIGDYHDPGALAVDNEITDALEHIPTRLKKFDACEQGRLINWGYALADVALRSRAGFGIAPSQGWPVPEWRLD